MIQVTTKDHPSGIKTEVNKKVIGMFEDEAAGNRLQSLSDQEQSCIHTKYLQMRNTKSVKESKRMLFKNYYSQRL